MPFKYTSSLQQIHFYAPWTMLNIQSVAPEIVYSPSIADY